MSKTAHILCIAAGHGTGRYAPQIGFTPIDASISATLAGDLWVGPRPQLETLKPVQAGQGVNGIVDIVMGVMGSLKRDAITKDPVASASDLLVGLAPQFKDMLSEKPSIAYPEFIQIIPYYLFRNKGRFFHYQRPDKGSEARLHGKVSIGVGGHVDLKDVVIDEHGRIDLAATLDKAGKREASEEIGATINGHAFRYIGILYAIDTEVDRLHLGIIGICDLTDEQAAGLKVNNEIGEHGFATLAETKARVDADPNKTLETWTRLVIESNPLA